METVMSFLSSNLGATVAYGVASLAAFGVASASKAPPLQKTSLVLLGSWAVSNIIFGTMTPPRLLTANGLMDLCGMWLCMNALSDFGFRNTKFMIALTYIAMLTCHVGWLIFNPTSFGGYFGTINALFATQLILVSGGSLNVITSNWRHRSLHNHSLHGRHSSDMGRR